MKKEFENVDNLIIQRLKMGMSQGEIAEDFKVKGIEPSSLSIIEKKLKKLKEEHRAKTLFHLAVILNKKGLL